MADEIKEAREVADAVWAIVVEHEEEEHDGEACLEGRLSLLAYIAHRIGVPSTPMTALWFAKLLIEYEENCPNVGEPHNPDDHPNVKGNGGPGPSLQ